MKKFIKLFICIALMLVSVYGIHYYYTEIEPTDINSKGFINPKDDLGRLSDLKEKYGNNEIVMYIDIPDVISLPIVQTDDNDYYLSHDLDKKENSVGTPFLDYRISSFHDKKVFVYGYNDVNPTLPFSALTGYQ